MFFESPATATLVLVESSTANNNDPNQLIRVWKVKR